MRNEARDSDVVMALHSVCGTDNVSKLWEDELQRLLQVNVGVGQFGGVTFSLGLAQRIRSTSVEFHADRAILCSLWQLYCVDAVNYCHI